VSIYHNSYDNSDNFQLITATPVPNKQQIFVRITWPNWRRTVQWKWCHSISTVTRMPPGWPANHAMSWTPCGSGRRRGRPTKTWRSTFKEDLVDQGVDWNSVRAVATDRSRWRTLAQSINQSIYIAQRCNVS